MSDMSKAARKSAKEKVQRLAAPTTSDIDASGWREPTMNANAKTGMRPISRRAFKKGGKVEGEKAEKHAGRKPRKAGGRSEDIGTALINRDQKKANEERGYPHVGGYKKGGNAKRKGFDIGGSPYGGATMPGMPQGKGSSVDRRVSIGFKKGGKAKDCAGGVVKKAKGGNATGGTRPSGDRIAKARGGKTSKGKTNIVIAINPAGMGGQQPQAAMTPPPPPPPAGVPMPMPMPPGAMGAAPMPMPAGMNGPAGPMPMGRNAGGRTGKMVGGPMMGGLNSGVGAGTMGGGMGGMGGMPSMGGPTNSGIGAGTMGMPMVMRKSGGKVGHRSYKTPADMDAGSGGGLGRLEKTEIQKKS